MLHLVTGIRDKALNLLLESGFVVEEGIRQLHFQRDMHAFRAVFLNTWDFLGESCVDFDHWSSGF